jgi:uroporphyrinogen-III synthase
LKGSIRPAGALRVVITRSKEGNEELSLNLRRAGFEPIPVDTISFSRPEDLSEVDEVLKSLHTFDWLVFTSAVGVGYFADRMKELSIPLPRRGKPMFASVGARTGERLSSLGLEPGFVPSAYLTERLADELPTEHGGRVLILDTDIADPKLGDRLRSRGFEVRTVVIYRTRSLECGETDRLEGANLIIFASPSAVKGFCRMLPDAVLQRMRRVRAVCIGPITAAAASENGFGDTMIPGAYTLDSVLEEIAGMRESRD